MTRKTYFFVTAFFVSFLYLTPTLTFASEQFTHSFGLGATDGATGGEVSRLQRFLSQDKTIYPEGVVSGYFGKLTERAVQKWQAKNKIVISGTAATTGYGWVGKKTRGLLNTKIGALPEITGALSLTVSGGITSQANLTKKSTYTNKLNASFFGAGNGQKAVFTQTSPNTKITTPASLSCVTPCSIENAVSVAPGIPAGVYQIKVTAVAGKESQIAYYDVTIGESESFSFTLMSSNGISMIKSLTGNTSGANEIIVRAEKGQVQPVTLTQTTNTKGLTVKNLLGTCTPPCAIKNAVSAGFDMLSGFYTVTVTGTAGNATRSLTYNVALNTSGKFGYHISNQEDPDRSITMTRPASQSVTSYVPLKFILDGGTPRPVRLTMAKLPDGVSAAINSCTIPCDATLSVTISPGIIIGTKSVSFSVEADYIDPVDGVQKVLKKSYAESVKVINGDQMLLNP